MTSRPPPLPTLVAKPTLPVLVEGVTPKLKLAYWLAVPSWLVSMIVHLIVMISLALVSMPELHETPPQILTVDIAAGEGLESMPEASLAGSDEMLHASSAGEPGEMLAQHEIGDIGNPLSGQGPGESSSPDLDAIDVGGMGDILGGSGGSGLRELGGSGSSAEFFGIRAGGRRFVFIVDCSNSMRGKRFRDAKREVLYAVRKLDSSQSFYVIFFGEGADRMFSGPGQEPETRPLPATSENLRRLEKWMPTVELEYRTDPYEAVKHAVEMRPDAIYLLSDGQFTDGNRTEEYLEANNQWNDPELGYQPRVVIHTIAFHSREGEPTMQAIANKYGGTYRFVAN